MTMNYRQYIVRDPAVCGGEPVVRGTRVTMRTVLASLAEGMSVPRSSVTSRRSMRTPCAR